MVSSLPNRQNIFAVVVTHNRPSLLEKCLRALAIPVVVVDMNSDQRTDDVLARNKCNSLHVIKLTENLGGSAGFSIGMRYAIEHLGADWVVLMDDDARPRPKAINNFNCCDRDTETIYCAAVFDAKGEVCEMNRPCINPFWSLDIFGKSILDWILGRSKSYQIQNDAFSAGPVQVDTATFVGFFVHRDSIAKIGYPNSEMFIYSDDILFSLRHRKIGGSIVFDPSLQFVHECETIDKTDPQRYWPLWKTYYSHRNSLISLRFGSGRLFWCIVWPVTIKWLLDARKYPTNSKTYLHICALAIWHGIRQDFSMPHSRIRLLTDDALNKMASADVPTNNVETETVITNSGDAKSPV